MNNYIFLNRNVTMSIQYYHQVVKWCRKKHTESAFGQDNNFLITYSDIFLLFIIHELKLTWPVQRNKNSPLVAIAYRHQHKTRCVDI